MQSASAHLDVALPLHTEHFSEVTLASAIESVQHLAHEGVSFVVVGARYNAVVDVHCHKDSVAFLVLSAPHSTTSGSSTCPGGGEI
jgi:hypothetical protein